KPLRFREAMSALHECVISDLRFKKKEKARYLAWKKQDAGRAGAIRAQTLRAVTAEIAARHEIPVPKEFFGDYDRARKKYWDARIAYSNYLRRHDMNLWRKLMPCDPVITVADDIVYFECFSADESSYGCLSVN